jgi:hypothetical protein
MIRRLISIDGVLLTMMLFITAGWTITGAIVWKDVLRNRDATDRAKAEMVEAVKVKSRAGAGD